VAVEGYQTRYGRGVVGCDDGEALQKRHDHHRDLERRELGFLPTVAVTPPRDGLSTPCQ
jgi:hypothetical protein